MAVKGKAEREVLKKARRVFVDFASVGDEQLIRCYLLCNEAFGTKDAEIVDDDKIRLICGKVEQVIDSLPAQGRQYIRYRYGFEDGVQHSFAEIYKLMGVSDFNLFRIRSYAFKQFRSKSKNIFVTNVIEQLELTNRANEEHILALENQIRNLRCNPVEVDTNSIDSLDWSVRTYNLLKRNGISTIEQLMTLKAERIWQWWGVGKVTAREIINNQKKVLEQK